MRSLFLSVILLQQALAIPELCFKLVNSIVRRDSVGVVTTTSQQGCNIRCIENPGCDACMFYADRGKCVLFGKPRAPPPGQCPPLRTPAMRKTNSGCPKKKCLDNVMKCSSTERRIATFVVVRSPFPPDRGYTPVPCSNPSDMICGIPPPGSRRLFPEYGFVSDILDAATNHCSWFFYVHTTTIYFESGYCVHPANPRGLNIDTPSITSAILYDGTRASLDNDEASFIDWDPYIGSWFFTIHMTTIYFRSGYCIHPAVPALPGCACAPIASIQQIPAGFTVDTSQPAPKIDDPYFCPSRALYVLPCSDCLRARVRLTICGPQLDRLLDVTSPHGRTMRGLVLADLKRSHNMQLKRAWPGKQQT
ncbi:hypothetical protein PRIPAC_88148, partial [Pristionchus pacificus]|uniref:Apple domain-containing protein n=1 Tax=Pristionchus pacificus TaxID=54126 RepID=A0A2A6B687_PRIPA